jgi:hypothetical protein
MGLTTSGFWYPDKNTPLTLRGIFSAAAVASENALASALVTGGVPVAASATALTAMFTAAGASPSIGNQGSINGLSVVWNGSAWVSTSERSGAEVTRTTPQSVGTGTWSAAQFSTSAVYGPAFSIPSPSGISIPVTGWYRCETGGTWQGNTNGRRLCGIGPTGNGQPSSKFSTQTASGYGGSFSIDTVQTMRFSGGAVVTGWFYQDSGATLSLTDRRLHIELVHAD